MLQRLECKAVSIDFKIQTRGFIATCKTKADAFHLRPLYGPATALRPERGVAIGSAADQLPPSMSNASTTSIALPPS